MIKFEPILKQTLWGGDKIIPFKHLPPPSTSLSNIGESWEISGVTGSESVAVTEPFAGKSLNALVAEMKGDLLGEENYRRFGTEFPLLVKFIDARKDLSIQVHPNDELAHSKGLPNGKTEMWYLMESEPGARLLSGLKKEITPGQYAQMVADDTICEAIAAYEVQEGDVFFLPGGRIHSIGAGCFLAEIQQTSDVTYRIYDYKRRDKDGHLRQLHTREAAEAIDYTVHDNHKTDYTPRRNEPVELVRCPHFAVALYDLDEPMTLDYSELDSFVILVGVKGGGTLTADGQTTTLQAGETVLIPATTKEIKVEGTVRFLEAYV